MCFFGSFCPTYNRELARKGEAKEVIKSLEEQTRAIPAKVRRLEAKVARQSSWLEALHRIRPDLQMQKQLGQEVQEAEVKMKQLEKAVKGLQRELEVEEGEHGSTDELVLELREVDEEVQVVDSHQREVEQLEEKLAELGEGEGGRSRGQEPGGSVEGGKGCVQEAAVRQANLTNCKETLETLETVLRQLLLINKLEARQNRLTQDNWRLRGSSRGGPILVTSTESCSILHLIIVPHS